jgi:hypothetical protein
VQETRPCDHQEYGTHNAAIYIQAWGSDKALMKLSEVLHLTSAPLILQVAGQIKIKNMKWLIEKAKPKVEQIIEVWDTYVSTIIKDLLYVFSISIA